MAAKKMNKNGTTRKSSSTGCNRTTAQKSASNKRRTKK